MFGDLPCFQDASGPERFQTGMVESLLLNSEALPP